MGEHTGTFLPDCQDLRPAVPSDMPLGVMVPTKAFVVLANEQACRGATVFWSSQTPFEAAQRFVTASLNRGKKNAAHSRTSLHRGERCHRQHFDNCKEKWVERNGWCLPASHKLSNMPIATKRWGALS